LEYDELTLLAELGHEVFSHGAYLDPAGHAALPRPAIMGMSTWPELAEITRANPAKTNLPQELIDWAEIVIVMHEPNWIIGNWARIKHLPVIWRTIGQSTAKTEALMKPYVDQGMKIVRYSPKERGFPNFAGEDVLLRFYKDEDVFSGWTGETHNVVTFAQTLKGRRQFCHYDTLFEVLSLFDGSRVYGSGNDDLGRLNGGEVPFERQLQIMQQSRVLLYGGTWPAPTTLSFIEALMMGLPIVSISKTLAHIPGLETLDFFECDEILAHVGGAVCDSPSGMAIATQRFRTNDVMAREMSEKQRVLAIGMFGKKKIMPQWKEFLDSL
jgi:hypothetical protein